MPYTLQAACVTRNVWTRKDGDTGHTVYCDNPSHLEMKLKTQHFLRLLSYFKTLTVGEVRREPPTWKSAKWTIRGFIKELSDPLFLSEAPSRSIRILLNPHLRLPSTSIRRIRYANPQRFESALKSGKFSIRKEFLSRVDGRIRIQPNLRLRPPLLSDHFSKIPNVSK